MPFSRVVCPSIESSRVTLLYVVCGESVYKWGIFMHFFILSRTRFMYKIRTSGRSLQINVSAPASSTATSLAGSPWEVYTMIWICWSCSRIFRVSFNPPFSPISRSVRMISGFHSLYIFHASAPSGAIMTSKFSFSRIIFVNLAPISSSSA